MSDIQPECYISSPSRPLLLHYDPAGALLCLAWPAPALLSHCHAPAVCVATCPTLPVSTLANTSSQQVAAALAPYCRRAL